MRQPDPFTLKALDNAEHSALKALYAGEATPEQQRLALSVIVNKIARANHLPYVPDSPDQSAFLAGRAFVGKQIEVLLNTPVGE